MDSFSFSNKDEHFLFFLSLFLTSEKNRRMKNVDFDKYMV